MTEGLGETYPVLPPNGCSTTGTHGMYGWDSAVLSGSGSPTPQIVLDDVCCLSRILVVLELRFGTLLMMLFDVCIVHCALQFLGLQAWPPTVACVTA